MKGVLIAATVSLIAALFGTPMFIKFLVRKGYGQFIRDDGPTTHHTKRGTPTMGGAVIIAASLVAYGCAHLFTMTPLTASGCSIRSSPANANAAAPGSACRLLRHCCRAAGGGSNWKAARTARALC